MAEMKEPANGRMKMRRLNGWYKAVTTVRREIKSMVYAEVKRTNQWKSFIRPNG